MNRTCTGLLRWSSALAVSALMIGCSPANTSTDMSGCGLGLPRPRASSLSAEHLVIDGTQIRNSHRSGGVEFLVLNAPASVRDAFEAYKERLAEEDLVLVSEDFEGFEAELYFQDPSVDGFVSMRFLSSTCDDVSSVTITRGSIVPVPSS